MRALILILLFSWLPTQAFAIPTDFNTLNFENLSTGPEFNGIAALSNCSGALFHFEGQSLDDQALILTNGHCIGGWRFLRPGEVKVHEQSGRAFRLFNRDGDALRTRFRATELVYATMTNTDMAVYRLEITYRELRNTHGVDSLLLATDMVAIGEPISIKSGYHSYITQCLAEHIVPQLHEAEWVMLESIRYSVECDTFPGTSGSPAISDQTNEIIGINNTGNEGRHDCSMNNPCERDGKGNKTVLPDRGYAQQSVWLYSCINEQYELDLDLAGCQLPQ